MKNGIHYGLILISTIAFCVNASQPQSGASAANAGTATVAQQPDTAAKANAKTNVQNQEAVLTPEEEQLVNELLKFPGYDKAKFIEGKKAHQAVGKGDEFIKKMKISLDARKKTQASQDRASLAHNQARAALPLYLTASVNIAPHSTSAAATPQHLTDPASAVVSLSAASNANTKSNAEVTLTAEEEAIISLQEEVLILENVILRNNNIIDRSAIKANLIIMKKSSISLDEHKKCLELTKEGLQFLQESLKKDQEAYDNAIAELPRHSASSANSAACSTHAAAVSKHLTTVASSASAALDPNDKNESEVTLTADEEELVALQGPIGNSNQREGLNYRANFIAHKKAALNQGRIAAFNSTTNAKLRLGRAKIAANKRHEEWLKETSEHGKVTAQNLAKTPALLAAHNDELQKQVRQMRTNFKEQETNVWLPLSTGLSSTAGTGFSFGKCIIG